MRPIGKLSLLGLAAFAFAALDAASAQKPEAAAPATDDCRPADGDAAVAVEIVGHDKALLADGRMLRLAGMQFPQFARYGGAAIDPNLAVAEALQALLLGRPARLRLSPARLDRYGRVMALVFAGEPGSLLWVQRELAARGLALADPVEIAPECVSPLIAAEAHARAQGLGFWGQGLFRIRDAADAGLLRHMVGSYQIVEGEVRGVTAAKGGATYINFGDDWRTDFTIVVAASALRREHRGRFDAQGLKGKRMRVRGWIEIRNGPSIIVSTLAQIDTAAGSAAFNARGE